MKSTHSLDSWNQQCRPRRRSGQVAVLVALSMTVLLGFSALAVDYGLLVNDANILQRACDSSALAGASQLKVTGVDSYDVAQANTAATAAFNSNTTGLRAGSTPTITYDSTWSKITVQSSTVQRFFFAKAIGISTGTVTRQATSGVSAADSLTTASGPAHVVPIGITLDTYNAYKNSTTMHVISQVRQNKDIFGLDNFVLFDLGGLSAKSPAHMENQVIGTESVGVKISDVETTLDAAQGQINHFESGIQTLFDNSDAAPWNDSGSTGIDYAGILAGTSASTNPRIVDLIITNGTSSPSNGTFQEPVLGFVPVYIQVLTNSPLAITVGFLPSRMLEGGGYTIAPTGTTMTGNRIVSLTG